MEMQDIKKRNNENKEEKSASITIADDKTARVNENGKVVMENKTSRKRSVIKKYFFLTSILLIILVVLLLLLYFFKFSSSSTEDGYSFNTTTPTVNMSTRGTTIIITDRTTPYLETTTPALNTSTRGTTDRTTPYWRETTAPTGTTEGTTTFSLESTNTDFHYKHNSFAPIEPITTTSEDIFTETYGTTTEHSTEPTQIISSTTPYYETTGTDDWPPFPNETFAVTSEQPDEDPNEDDRLDLGGTSGDGYINDDEDLFRRIE